MKNMRTKLLHVLIALAAAAALAQGPSASNSPPAKDASINPTIIVTNAAPASLIGYVPDDKYKLRVGDRISFQIAEDRDAPKSLVIADDGEVDMPYLGRVSAADKTCKQLADDLKTRNWRKSIIIMRR